MTYTYNTKARVQVHYSSGYCPTFDAMSFPLDNKQAAADVKAWAESMMNVNSSILKVEATSGYGTQMKTLWEIK